MSNDKITGPELWDLLNAVCKKQKTHLDKIAGKLDISRRTLYNKFQPTKEYRHDEVTEMLEKIGADPKDFPITKSCEEIIKENKYLKTLNAQLISENNSQKTTIKSMQNVIDNFIKKQNKKK